MDMEESMPYVNKMINMTKIIALIYMLDIITFELIQDCYDKIYNKLPFRFFSILFLFKL